MVLKWLYNSAADRSLTVAALIASALLFALPSHAQDAFRIKYVAEGVVYINGGRSAGLAEGMKLTVTRKEQAIAHLTIDSLAEASAVCEIKDSTAPLEAGDAATLSFEDAQKAQMLRTAGGGSHYAQTITFTEGDPMDEEVREYMPHPKLPEINRFRGRISFEYAGFQGQGISSSQFGVALRGDITRIGGTYWNLGGYTRILQRSSSTQPTLNDLLNRTYTFGLTYSNPKSDWTLGFGRLYLPWATSLGTLDGGYVGRRVAKNVTIGMFAGTTPDPTSWNYAANREMAGTFVGLDGGSYEALKYSSTVAVGVSRLSWRSDKEFVLFENSISWRRYFSIFHTLEVDRHHPTVEQPTANGASIGHSFLTVRFEPNKFISFDLNHNYFGDYPTFNPQLVGTGLLDKILFQGFSGGARVALPYHASVYVNVGRSKGNSDPNPAWNYLYGLTLTDIFHTGFRADAHYSRFHSSFGSGDYKSVSLSRQLGEGFRLEAQAGEQAFSSGLTAQSRSRFVNGMLDWNFARHYFLGAGITIYRGQTQNYNQPTFTLGYRF